MLTAEECKAAAEAARKWPVGIPGGQYWDHTECYRNPEEFVRAIGQNQRWLAKG